MLWSWAGPTTEVLTQKLKTRTWGCYRGRRYKHFIIWAAQQDQRMAHGLSKWGNKKLTTYCRIVNGQNATSTMWTFTLLWILAILWNIAIGSIVLCSVSHDRCQLCQLCQHIVKPLMRVRKTSNIDPQRDRWWLQTFQQWNSSQGDRSQNLHYPTQCQ